MFEHPAGSQDHRVLIVWLFVRCDQPGWHKQSATGRCGKSIAKHDFVPRVIGPVAWISHAVLFDQSVPGDVIERRHAASHLGEDIAWVVIVPVEPQTLGDRLDDLPVLPGFAR